MTINWLHLIILILQSTVQSWFLSGYFQLGRRGLVIYTLFFMFGLYPLNMLIPVSWAIAKNILNLAAVVLFSRVLMPGLAWKKSLLAAVLYWLCLPLCEIPVHLLIWWFRLEGIFEAEVFSLFGHLRVITFVMQLLATLNLALLYGMILQRTRAAKGNQIILMYMTSLFASLACLAFFSLCLVYPKTYSGGHMQYPVVIVILVLFNVWFVISLHRYVKQQTELRASQLIRQEYRRQMQQMLKPELSRQELRRFRHDLINELEHRRLSRENDA